MERLVQFRNKVIVVVFFIAAACHEGRVTYTIPPIVLQADDKALHIVNGVLYHDTIPFSGYTFQLFANGDTARLVPYYAGREEGWMKAWHPNQHLAEERFFIHGKKEGVHKGWWENGQQKFEYLFANDEHEGEAKEWYMNGKAYRVFHYTRGHEDGLQKMWWENGDVRANYVVKNGERFGIIGQKLCKNLLNNSLK